MGQLDRRRLARPRLLRATTPWCRTSTRRSSSAARYGPKAPLLLSAGVVLLDGCRRLPPGATTATRSPRASSARRRSRALTRRDYVENSNDSYWLPSARFRLTGFPRIIGPEGTPRLRTRLGLVQAEQRLAGTDGLGPAGFTLGTMKAVFNGNRNLSAELLRGRGRAGCPQRGPPTSPRPARCWRRGTCAPTSARAARCCGARCGRRSTPGHPWSRALRPGRPGQHPARLDAASATSSPRCAARSTTCGPRASRSTCRWATSRPSRAAAADRDPRLLGDEGCFNIISTRRDEQGNYGPYTGSSFVMAAGLTPRAARAARAILPTRSPRTRARRYYARPDAAALAGEVAADALHRRAIKADPATRTGGGDRPR